MPNRIQRHRTKGWRTPLCSCGCGKPARYVGRGTKWGNPVTIKKSGKRWRLSVDNGGSPFSLYVASTEKDARSEAVRLYRMNAALSPDFVESLRGHDLMCWCPIGLPCHADVLIKYANKEIL